MINTIKDILFGITIGCGTISLICLMVFLTWRCFCLCLDSCKNANALRKMIQYYAEHHCGRILKAEDINLKKMGIEKREE